jgi:hypothetical protein
LQAAQRGRRRERAELAHAGLRVNSSRITLPLKRARPSIVFSATLPVKPSVTTTSTSPEKMTLPST